MSIAFTNGIPVINKTIYLDPVKIQKEQEYGKTVENIHLFGMKVIFNPEIEFTPQTVSSVTLHKVGEGKEATFEIRFLIDNKPSTQTWRIDLKKPLVGIKEEAYEAKQIKPRNPNDDARAEVLTPSSKNNKWVKMRTPSSENNKWIKIGVSNAKNP